MRINLFAGPSTGKSLMAAHLFDALRRDGACVEQVQEVIKPRAYRGDWPSESENLDIFTEQLKRERDWLESGVPHIVTDSPIFLQCYYLAARNAWPTLGCLTLAREWELKHPTLNILLTRCPDIQYQQAGRYQDQKAAELIDTGIAEFLRAEGVEVYRHSAGDRPGLIEHIKHVLGDSFYEQPRKSAKAA